MPHEPILYVVVRSDMESLNPGKAMAQVAHAANQFWKKVSGLGKESKNSFLYDLASQWSEQADGFGTTIVLDGLDGPTMVDWYSELENSSVQMIRGVTVDPQYPIRDGKVTHLVPDVMTCMFVFGDKFQLEHHTRNFKLHR